MAGGADDPGMRALQQQQLLRQQQDAELQLRLQHAQRAVQSPPADAQKKQAQERLSIDQQQRQQQSHYRQSIEPQAAQPADDFGTRRAKTEMERFRARQQDQQQTRQFEREMQRESGK